MLQLRQVWGGGEGALILTGKIWEDVWEIGFDYLERTELQRPKPNRWELLGDSLCSLQALQAQHRWSDMEAWSVCLLDECKRNSGVS